MAPEFIPGI